MSEAAKTAEVVTDALSRSGFELAQWASSHKTILSMQDKNTETLLILSLDDAHMERALGLWWDCKKDTFQIRFGIQEGGKSKRELLRTLASIFDPLGFFAPVTLIAKTLIQEIWRKIYDYISYQVH